MLAIRSLGLATASLVVCFNGLAQYADSVVSYTSGTGVNASYTDPTRALGSPTVYNGYQNTDPFNPAYQSTDLVSVGAGGSLTLAFNSPILNDPTHPFGLDFIIFGNTGFVEDFSTRTTDGSLFGNNTGTTRVWVSADNLTYYELDPTRAPTVDGLFPTDAAGAFSQPVNPALTSSSFAGLDLAGIRTLYHGSGGGTGYDISWAEDSGGHSVFLPSISYVRVDVLSGKSEIDAVAAVPEPGSLAIALAGAVIFWLRGRLFPANRALASRAAADWKSAIRSRSAGETGATS
jgi:hypothetical protein